MSDRVLGIDGGGTKTLVVAADATGCVQFYMAAGGMDPTASTDWEKSLAAVAVALGPVQAAVLGLPYHGEIPSVSARQIMVGQTLFGLNCQVVNDVAVAFEGALAGQDGVLILSGTGSMAWARGPAGVVRVGGWGDAFGDEGSAHWIGRAALGIASRHFDGRQDSAEFAHALLQRLGVTEHELIAWTYGQMQPRIAVASAAREVSALADAGDLQAQALMQAAAEQLAMHGLAAARLSGAALPLRWAVAGSVMRDATLSAALAHVMGNSPQSARLPPVGGAVLAAARHAGWPIDSGFIDRLAASLSHALLATDPPVAQTQAR